MAIYGLKYRSIFTDAYGIVNRVEIHEKNYVGNVVAITLGGQKFTIERSGSQDSKFFAIQGSQCTLELNTMFGVSIFDFISENLRQFRVTIYINNGLHWQGFILSDVLTQPFGYASWFKLVAVDNLKALEASKYLDPDTGAVYFNPITPIAKIANLLRLTGLSLPINTVFSLKPHSNPNVRPLESWMENPRRFHTVDSVDTAYNVLKEFCERFGAVCFQSNGEWWLIRIKEWQGGSPTIRKYTATGEFMSESVVGTLYNDFKSINNANGATKLVDGVGEYKFLTTWHKEVVTLDMGDPKNQLNSGRFNVGNPYLYSSSPIKGWNIIGGINATTINNNDLLGTNTIRLTGGVVREIDDSNYTIESDRTDHIDNAFLVSNCGTLIKQTLGGLDLGTYQSGIELYGNEKLSISFKYRVQNLNGIRIQIILSELNDNTFAFRYSLDNQGKWRDSVGSVYCYYLNSYESINVKDITISDWKNFNIDTDTVPSISKIDTINLGDFNTKGTPIYLFIRVFYGYSLNAVSAFSISEFDYFSVTKKTEADVNKKLTATITKNGIWGDTDEITVLCGESSTDYECNLLELDGYTPVKGWTDTNQKLIDLLATDRMNQYKKPSLLFNCTFEGGSPAYHNLIQFNFLDISNRLFMPIHWVYGAVDRVVEADLVELFTGKQAQTIEKRYQDFSGRMVLYAKAEVLGNPAVLLLKVWAIADTEYLISEDVHLMLSVVNTTNVPVTSATVKVTLPTGVNYIGGATSASGNELYFSFANIAANQESLPTAFTVQSSIGEDYTIPCEITVADGQAPENTEINAETGLPYSQAQILLTWYDPQFGTPTECVPTKKPLRDLPGVSVIFGRLYHWESLLYLGIEIRTDAPLNNEKLIVVHPNSIPTLEWGAGYTFPYGTHVLIDIIPITYTPINGYIRYMAINTGVTFADFLATQDLSAWKLYFEGTTLEAQLNIYHNF